MCRNTKTLAALKCVMQTKIAQSAWKDMDPYGSFPMKLVGKALGVTSRVFRVQNSSFEVFGGGRGTCGGGMRG